MTISLLEYLPTSQNQRVASFEVPGDENSLLFTTQNLLSASEMDILIEAAYRQIFNEQQMLVFNRQKALESQLRNGQITVRDFIRGLVLSDSFRRNNYEVNNNYCFSQMCVQRILGRDIYNEQEKIAWSIVIATKGLQGFIDELLNSDEYMSNFGFHTVPYQRRRILPQRPQGELPFARMPRYGEDYRVKLEAMGYFKPIKPMYRWSWQQPPYPLVARLAGAAIVLGGASLLAVGTVAVALAALEIISL